jgi:NADH-quinone oxidoreductase subunit A
MTTTWPLVAYAVTVGVVIVGMLGLSFVLGPRHGEGTAAEPYESGIVSTGSARSRHTAQFYLIATFFVVIDLESAFLFAWAAAVRELGWAGFVEALVFVVLLLAALVYLWRVGALDLRPRRRAEVETKEP